MEVLPVKKKAWIIAIVLAVVSVALAVLLVPHLRRARTDTRTENYNDQWIDPDTAQLVDTIGMDMTITQIYANCFFGKETGAATTQIKVNGVLPEQWCVGDRGFVHMRLVYRDAAGRYEGELLWVSDDVFMGDIPMLDKKPVIYLYPEEETEVSVKLAYEGKLTCTYPAYDGGWKVTAKPDGTLTDAKGQIYNYLYWEGESDAPCDLSKGFCVAGADTAAFLEDALEKLGLNRREANEFIVYWLPLMEGNAYNLISFDTAAYEASAKLEIEPAPDTLIRVFMTWQASGAYVEMEPMELTAPERTGFTVIEWGGGRIS